MPFEIIAESELDDAHRGLWLAPDTKPLTYHLMQYCEGGSDPIGVLLDAGAEFRQMFSEQEPVLEKARLVAWAKELRQLAEDLDAAIARGFYSDGPLDPCSENYEQPPTAGGSQK